MHLGYIETEAKQRIITRLSEKMSDSSLEELAPFQASRRRVYSWNAVNWLKVCSQIRIRNSGEVRLFCRMVSYLGLKRGYRQPSIGSCRISFSDEAGKVEVNGRRALEAHRALSLQ